MYRLLLVTHKQDVSLLYTEDSEWENLGFEHPEVAQGPSQAESCLSGGHFDVVSWLLPIQEGKEMARIMEEHPEVLGMETARDRDNLHRQLGEIRRELASREAERGQDTGDDMTLALQREFFCSLLMGEPFTREEMLKKCRGLEIGTDPDWPVAAASFRLPQGDYFLAEVWHYGRERLENALRNIFEVPDAQAQYILLTINPHHMRLLQLARVPMTRDDAYAHMLTHLHRCQVHLEQFFELSMNIKRVVPYDSLAELGIENMERMAH